LTWPVRSYGWPKTLERTVFVSCRLLPVWVDFPHLEKRRFIFLGKGFLRLAGSKRDGLFGPELKFAVLVLFGFRQNVTACNASHMVKDSLADLIYCLDPINYAAG
jgi:hypothetical protein